MGQSLDIIIPENLRARHWDGYRRTMATGESRYGEADLLAVPGLRKDGRRVSVEFTIVMLKDAQGNVTGTAAILRDVTKQFDELRKLRRQLAEAKAG
jgi:PAS domain S-box-containing protein